MNIFLIDSENRVTAYSSAKNIPTEPAHFGSENELASLIARWPGARLVENLE